MSRKILLDRRALLMRLSAGLLASACVLETRAVQHIPKGLSRDDSGTDWITADAQRAIDKGLAFLAATQHQDGSFGDRLQYHGNVAVTSLAALAFMSGGHLPGRGVYGTHVLRALKYVLSKEQRTPPGFLNFASTSRQGAMYSHGFGTLFLAEVYGMIAEPELSARLKRTLERAVRLIETTQNAEGGWRYDPEPRQADVSVTICQIMALRAARNAGFPVDKDVVEKCIKYVRSCQTSDGGFSYFSHQPQAGSEFARSAAAIVALYSAGVYEGEIIERGLKYIHKFKPSGRGLRRDMDLHYYYGHYYAAQAMWTAGGKHWADWYPAIRDELTERTRNRPDGAWVDPMICNHYATAMACIILQIPNNYLPILQK